MTKSRRNIKSSKVATKFAKPNKLQKLDAFIQEYQSVVKQFIDIFWKEKDIPSLPPRYFTEQVNSKTWLTLRAVQCAGKQAAAIVNGTRLKQKQRMFRYHKLLNEDKLKQARKLKKIIDSKKVSKPSVKSVCPELDSRFVKVDLNSKTTFNWITLSSLGNQMNIKIPFKKTIHFNHLNQAGKMLNGIRVSKKTITFNFELPKVEKKNNGETVGLDVGIINTFTLSNGAASAPDNHNHTLQTITQKLSRKQKGSKAFQKAQAHRKNYINWSLNQLDLSNIKTIRIEDLKNIRKYKRTSRFLSHFTYTEIFEKLEDLSKQNGVRLQKVNYTYTSQRCSNCGWVRRGNRKGKHFQCDVCKFEQDADINAAVNIATSLREISQKERLQYKNRKGFYLNTARKKPIVSSTQKPKSNI